MTVQFSLSMRNSRLDQVEIITGTAPTLTMRTGAPPANCAAARAGTVLATIALPTDWMAAAASGAKGINGGPWTDASADATGTFGHFSIDQGATCHIQGTAGLAGNDMIIDAATVTAGQNFSITSFTLTDGNA